MAKRKDVREVAPDGEISQKRRFDQRDFNHIQEFVIDEWTARKRRRKDMDTHFTEVDRQIAMQPDVRRKRGQNGKLIPESAWMAEIEMPLQAQALEVLTADARRLLFPDSGAWFRAHTAVTDEFLRKVDFKSLILGDELETPSVINQDNADKLVEGFLLQMFRRNVNGEDFFTAYDRINADAFKYGVGIGRVRMMRRNVYETTANGVTKELQKSPWVFPVSVKNVYLDDSEPSVHSIQLLNPAHIAEDRIRFENLQIAANRGSNDPEDEDGGWMPRALKTIEPDDKGYVTLLEMEGDIVVPRKTTNSVVIPGGIMTVAVGGKDGGAVTSGVVRMRFRKYPWSSYLLHPYHIEGSTQVYPASPLMKGRPLQALASAAAGLILDSAALKVQPPVSFDRTDQYFAQTGGPLIFPSAQWGSSDANSIRAHSEIGGDPGTMVAMFSQAVSLYAELTGVLPARLGAQTNSHTTAFAKDAELQRGSVRTVDYVRACGHGPLTQLLGMVYKMARDSLGSSEEVPIFIDAYGGYVSIGKEQLPEMVTFEWFGSGGPADEQQKRQSRLSSLNLATQLDQLNIAQGKPGRVDIDAAIRQVLRDGTWTDVDSIMKLDPPPTSGVARLPPPDAAAGGSGPGAVVAALQNLTGAA